MSDKALVCSTCKGEFRDKYNLRRHQNKKKPCQPPPVSDAEKTMVTAQSDPVCNNCGVRFTNQSNLYRHLRNNICAKVVQPSSAIVCSGQPTASHTTVINITNNNITNNNNATINVILPFRGETLLPVTVQTILTAFRDNPQLMECIQLSSDDMANPHIGGKFVDRILMECIREVHKDPTARNVYLSIRREDQAVVLRDHWEVIDVPTVIHTLCSKTSAGISRSLYDEKSLVEMGEIANNLAIANIMYKDDPSHYHKEIKKSLVAHLTNMRPSAATLESEPDTDLVVEVV